MGLLRQHLIDPEICIRCNTCEATCPNGAVTHNDDNYVVDASLCGYCMDCINPCPTGAIDSWRNAVTPYSLEEQMGWEELPTSAPQAEKTEDLEALEAEANALFEVAHAGQGGKARAPASADKPSINPYTHEAPAVARVMGNLSLTAKDAESDINHIVLDLGSTAFPVLEGQSIGILPPGTDAQGNPHHVRLYTLSSPRDGERPNHNNLALTIKRVRGETGPDGVASNYMCDLKQGEEVRITGPFGASFLMPMDPQANIIMICTGTGAAPFRAMTEYRRRHMQGASGKLLLFFGARTPDELPYHGPLRKLPGSLIDTELVYSRLADQPKEYVQDRMRKRSVDIARLIQDERTCVYICGLKGMEQGVADAFEAICREQGLDWSKLKQAMGEAGRYHVETY